MLNRLCRSFAMVALVGLAALPQATPVAACSLGALDRKALPTVADQSHLIAIGTWVRSTERVAFFRVDQPLKGARPGDVVLVDNRGTSTAFHCDPYQEVFDDGWRFKEGDRHILFLQPGHLDDVWHVGYYSRAAFEIPAGRDERLVMDWGSFQGLPDDEAPTYADIVRAAGPSAAPFLRDDSTPWPQVIAASATIIILALCVAAWKQWSLPQTGD